MIDTHIHLIPGVDDGATNLTISMEMLYIALQEGIDEMILTPHYYVPNYVSEDIDKQFQLLKSEISEKGLNIKIHLGNEVYLNEESIKGFEDGRARNLSNSSYVLMELPFNHFYPFHENLLYQLQLNGHYIILAHVERYRIFKSNPKKLEELIEKGYYGQLTSSFISNSKTTKIALEWIKSGYIHLVASDAHNNKKRPPQMKASYEIVSKKYGEDCAKLLFEENPRRIINNEPLKVPKIELKQSSFLKNIVGLFK